MCTCRIVCNRRSCSEAKGAGENRSGEHQLIVVPAALRSEILHAIHDSPEGGHIGLRATLRKAQEHFWWPKMQSEILRICRQLRSLPKIQEDLWDAARRSQPHPPQETGFFTRSALITWGLFPPRPVGNRYIIVAVDYLSKYVEVAAVPSLAASHVIDFLKGQNLNGDMECLKSSYPTMPPRSTVASYALSFTRREWSTTSRHPLNGLPERTNQTIQAQLAPCVKTNKAREANWDKHLQSAAYSVNTSVQCSTGTTSYEIVYGQLPKHSVVAGLDTPVNVGQAVDRQDACSNIRRKARDNIRAAQKTQKAYYDRRRRRTPPYAVGDEVWVQRGNRQQARSLLPQV
ncbi:hypothetical protein HPB48_016358 [Haemaphysalis longicornis]|uniref:RNA-directed DNA polymerase n=1 Tax=Haemaphysalis longicornis TaxID=44386 RepID=A0A9J6H3I3_HAELO|nr:hypothetical protein HPB48_016358 [Haemaphysalis longicornis]